MAWVQPGRQAQWVRQEWETEEALGWGLVKGREREPEPEPEQAWFFQSYYLAFIVLSMQGTEQFFESKYVGLVFQDFIERGFFQNFPLGLDHQHQFVMKHPLRARIRKLIPKGNDFVRLD